MEFVKDIVFKLVGMLANLLAMITVFGYVLLTADLDVSKVVSPDVLDVHPVRIPVVQNQQVELVLIVDSKVDVHHLVSIIVIRIVLDGDVDHFVE